MWMRLELSLAAFNQMQLQPNCLIHSVVDRGTQAQQDVHGVIVVMLEADVELVGQR